MLSWWVTALRHQILIVFLLFTFSLSAARLPEISLNLNLHSMNFKLHLQCSWPDVVSNLPGPDQSNSSVRPLPKPLVGSTATWKSCCCPQMGSQNMHVQSISNTEVSLNLHTQSWWSVGTNKTLRSCVLWELYPPQCVNSFLPSVLYICIHRHLQSIWQMFIQWEAMFLYHSYGHLMFYPNVYTGR